MAQRPASPKPYRTIEARPNAESLIKPGELVDLVEVTPLTLADRRIYNQLLENAWDAIDKPVTHVISKSDLRGSHNSNDRVGETIERLMCAFDTGEEPRSSGHDMQQSLEIAIALKLSAHSDHQRISLPLEDRGLRLFPHPYRLLGGDVAGYESIGYRGPPEIQ